MNINQNAVSPFNPLHHSLLKIKNMYWGTTAATSLHEKPYKHHPQIKWSLRRRCKLQYLNHVVLPNYCARTHTCTHPHNANKIPRKKQESKENNGEPRINYLFQIIVRARTHTHTHTHKLIQRQENTKKRVETQYTRNSNSHANVQPFTCKVKRDNK